jgi:hypothetical protein
LEWESQSQAPEREGVFPEREELCVFDVPFADASSARPAGSIDAPIAPVALTTVLREMSAMITSPGVVVSQSRVRGAGWRLAARPPPLLLARHSFRNAPYAREFQSHVNPGTMCRNLNFVHQALFAPTKNNRAAV